MMESPLTIELECTVVFPQTFRLSVPSTATVKEREKLVKDYAGYLMETSQSNPIIQSCSDSRLEE